MRKSLLFTGLFAVVFAFAACCGKGGNKQEEGAEKCAMSEVCKAKAEFQEKWAKFDSLSVEVQAELIAKRVECYTKCLADTTKCAEKKCCKEMSEMTEEQKAECLAKKEEIMAKKAELAEVWANFDNLTLQEKKEFFDKVDSLMPKKPCCKKDGEGKCCHKEGEKKCEGKH